MTIKIRFLAFLPAILLAACNQNTPNAPKTPPAEQTAQTASAGSLSWAGDQDLVCEMKVDQTAEDTLHYKGKVYGFCSESCKAKFQENPSKYGVK